MTEPHAFQAGVAVALFDAHTGAISRKNVFKVHKNGNFVLDGKQQFRIDGDGKAATSTEPGFWHSTCELWTDAHAQKLAIQNRRSKALTLITGIQSMIVSRKGVPTIGEVESLERILKGIVAREGE
jgi:hypothetical protein